MILNPEAFVRADNQRRLERESGRVVLSETQCNPCRSHAPKARFFGTLLDAFVGSRIRLT